MKIKWKRVLIAGLYAELLLLAIYVPALKYILLPARQYSIMAFAVIAVVALVGSIFLGGLWAARKIDSRFLLHGVLIGIVAQIVYAALRPIVLPDAPAWGIGDLVAFILKILGAMMGAYLGGRLRKRQLSR